MSALKEVFLVERPMLLRLLTARLGGREDAEDALQDMWLKLDQLAPGPAEAPMAHPGAYLYRMATNLAADRRIARGRAQARDTAWLDVQPEADEHPDAEKALIAREALKRVEGAIAEMPERMRTALRLFRIEHRSQKEIAQELGVTVSGVEKLLKRAYHQLYELQERGCAD